MSKPTNKRDSNAQCPALLISAAASGQGKTTVTAALAWHFRQQGLNVRVFKTGPDFLDPQILQAASGNPVYQLDLWMLGETQCRQLLYEAAVNADLILIEGVMGLYDGEPSSADLARLFNIPVLAVIDASAMAGTFGAIASGLKNFDTQLNVAGVLANRTAGEAHAQMLQESLPENIKWFGALHHNHQISLPERHLGILLTDEISDLEEKLNTASTMLENNGLSQPSSSSSVEFRPTPEPEQPGSALKNIRIGIAHDAAFCFCYQANLDLLEALGAELIFFSPMHDNSLPEIDSLYLPGGYPELHLESLHNNLSMRTAIKQHYSQGQPLVAECGGLLYLMDAIADTQGNCKQMTGVLSGDAILQKRLVNLSMQSMELPEGTIRGHSFHHSLINTPLQATLITTPNGKYGSAESVFRDKKLLASYMHLYMPSNPFATCRLFTP
ncbi:MAG TPA: cobyrinate a,c-diamide synthase [Gammaproteobacteria bacterium]|nr:cobyrinate a,c-diamide synthase [Gammaproteobacteria bacterium]